MNKVIKWKESSITLNIKVPEVTFDDIITKINNKDIQKIAPEVALLLEVKTKMWEYRSNFNQAINKFLEEYDLKFNKLNDYVKEELKPKIIKYVEANGVEKQITKAVMDVDGKIIDKIETDFQYKLPPGFIYSRGRVEYIYNEDLIKDDKYYFKRLIKSLVKEDIEKGLLAPAAITKRLGAPSITFRISDIKKGIARSEKKK